MTTYDDDSVINPAADAKDSLPDFAQEKRRYIRGPTEGELDPDSAYHIPGVAAGDIVFGGYVGSLPEFVPGDVGVVVQPVTAEEEYSIYSLKFDGKWDKRIGEPTSMKPPGYRWSEKLRGHIDDAGHGVSRTVLVTVLRRDDPTPYTVRFQGPEASTGDALVTRTRRLGMPLYGVRWRLFLEQVEDDRGRTFRNWAHERVAKFGEASPEAPTPDEYRAARALAKSAALAAASAPSAKPASDAWDAPPPYEAPPPESIDDYYPSLQH
jgi:hypothetical protein